VSLGEVGGGALYEDVARVQRDGGVCAVDDGRERKDGALRVVYDGEDEAAIQDGEERFELLIALVILHQLGSAKFSLLFQRHKADVLGRQRLVRERPLHGA